MRAVRGKIYTLVWDLSRGLVLECGLGEVEPWQRRVHFRSKTEDTHRPQQQSWRSKRWCELDMRWFGPGFLSSTGFRLWGLRHSSLQEMTREEQADSLLLVVHVGGEECESDYCIPPASLIWAAAVRRFAACQVALSRPTWQSRCLLPHASLELKACLVFRNSRLMCQKVFFSTLICMLVACFPQWLGEKMSSVLRSPYI